MSLNSTRIIRDTKSHKALYYTVKILTLNFGVKETFDPIVSSDFHFGSVIVILSILSLNFAFGCIVVQS